MLADNDRTFANHPWTRALTDSCGESVHLRAGIAAPNGCSCGVRAEGLLPSEPFTGQSSFGATLPKTQEKTGRKLPLKISALRIAAFQGVIE